MSEGMLTLIVGPMFSGKTTELHRLFERKTRAGIACLLVKYQQDVRYSTDHVVSHKDMFGNYRQIPCFNINTLSELTSLIDLHSPETIFIDEIQFFPDKQVIGDLLNRKINVTASGLNGDWQRKMFPGMADLFALAYDIKMFQAVCGFCKSENACYSKKICEEGGIGGEEKYRAACHSCYSK
jgi:thymidine kinase